MFGSEPFIVLLLMGWSWVISAVCGRLHDLEKTEELPMTYFLAVLSISIVLSNTFLSTPLFLLVTYGNVFAFLIGSRQPLTITQHRERCRVLNNKIQKSKEC